MALSLNVRNFNASKVNLVKGIAKENRMPPINMKYGDDEKTSQYFNLILPLSTINLLVREDPKTKEVSYTLTYSLTNCDNFGRDKSTDNSDIGIFYNSLLELENKIKKTVYENAADWLDKDDFSEEMVGKLFNRTIRVSQEKLSNGKKVATGKFPPSLWVKVPVYEGKVSISNEGIIDNKGNPIDNVTPENLVNIFPKYSQAKLIISGRVYTMNGGSYGVTWTLKGAQVMPSNKIKAIELFAESNEEEDNREHITTESEMVQPVEEKPQEQATNVVPPSRKKRAAVNQ